MIDAYEIGIQLLLHDDVSAGLAVINRGLSDVDRGIAATSAHLSSLVQDSQMATKAVAAAMGAKPVQASVQQQAHAVGPEEAERHARPIELETAGQATESVRDAGERTLEVPAAPVVTPAVMSVSPGDRRSSDGPTSTPVEVETRRRVDGPTQAASAPNVRSVIPDRPEVVRQESGGAGESLRRSTDSVREPVAPVAVAVSVVEKPLEVTLPATGQVAPRGASPTAGPVAVTAAVAQSRVGSSRAGSAPSMQRQPEISRRRDRERAVAPPPGTQLAGKGSEGDRMDERAAAPLAENRDRSEGGAGTVMLDGRLVGQWLADHLARDASRPPAGTSFFDPRQTPAWNISGAL